MNRLITKSAEDTQKLAEKFAKKYAKGAIITLSGPLGAGKTTFAAGFAKGLGIKSKLISPTFILVREYELPFTSNAKLYHIDLYRLENKQQILNLGLNDIFDNHRNIILIEWAEKLANLQNKPIIKINFKYLTKSKRQITITD